LGIDDIITIASNFAEIKINKNYEFYDYKAKYLDPNGAELITSANLNDNVKNQLTEMSKKIFKILQCSGLARIDFFVKDEDVYFSEINTLPGFTPISMYPKLWENSGIDGKTLINKLIEEAVRLSK
jgi:D-alanine-D-alanine ligase